MPAHLELPAAYSLHAREQLDGVVLEASRLAAAGAEEGTLVWARKQTAVAELLGQPWPSPPGNLYCALVLRPESEAERDPAIALLALCACGSVLGELAPAMTDLKYRWPDQVVINGGTAAVITLDPAAAGAALVLGVFINVASHADDRDPPATALYAESFPDARVEDLLTGFCRHFALWAARWSEKGVEPAARTIAARLDPALRALRGRDGRQLGTITDIDAQGAACVDRDGEQARVTLADHFGMNGARETRP